MRVQAVRLRSTILFNLDHPDKLSVVTEVNEDSADDEEISEDEADSAEDELLGVSTR